MAELPKDKYSVALGFLLLGAIWYLPFDLNKRHGASYVMEFPKVADTKPPRRYYPLLEALFSKSKTDSTMGGNISESGGDFYVMSLNHPS